MLLKMRAGKQKTRKEARVFKTLETSVYFGSFKRAGTDFIGTCIQTEPMDSTIKLPTIMPIPNKANNNAN
jgi:hypothetical protein